MLRVIVIMEILASMQSPIAFSLLAKIFNFGKYVRLAVCLSVCLFVRMNVVTRIQVAPLDQSSPILTYMCILVIARNAFIILVKGQIIGSRG